MATRISSLNPSVALRYSLLSIPLAALGLPFYIYAPTYLVENKGLSFGTVAALFVAARIADAATDLPIGWLTDRWGGLRRWMIAGAALIMFGGIALVYAQTALLSAVAILLIFTGWSAIVVPWLTSVSRFPSAQQNPLISWRETLLAMGTLLGLTLPTLLADQIEPVLLLAAVILLLTITIQPGRGLIPQGRNAKSSSTAIPAVTPASNRQQRPTTLLSLWALNTTANAAPGTVIVMFVEQVLGAAGSLSIALLMFFIGAVLGSAAGAKLIARWGALSTWRWSILAACLSFTPVYFLGPAQVDIYLAICLISGVFAGIDNVVPIALQGQWLAKHQQQAQQGTIYGAWSMTVKLGFGFAVALTFGLLSLSSSNEPSTNAIAATYVLIPVALKLLLVVLLSKTSIAKKLT